MPSVFIDLNEKASLQNYCHCKIQIIIKWGKKTKQQGYVVLAVLH